MIEQLRAVAARYQLGEEALQAIVEVCAAATPRIPTVRAGSGGASSVPLAPSSAEDFKRRYEDRGLIAVGGFSEVREVWDHHLQRKVALKTQLPSRVSPDDCARFRAEAQITAQLQHPGVVPLHDWGELPDGRVWFTMKRVRGDTIGKRIGALHRLQGSDFVQSLRRLLDDFRRLCEPIAFAHAQGIIHRDITPQNLMVGDLGEAHVMDWGLARRLSGDRRATPASGAEEGSEATDPSDEVMRTRVAGTPFYMPPEQARGEIALMGPPSDVYALGAVLYEILVGHPPYAGAAGERASPEQILERVLHGSPPDIERAARPEAPEELCALCRKAMERVPGNRYENGEAIMVALRDWLDGADRRARARRIVENAQEEHQPRIAQKRAEAERLKRTSREILHRLQPFDRAQDKAEAWKLADDGALLEQEALREEIHWTQKLRSALNEAPDLPEAHAALADHYAGSLLRAEAAHDEPAALSFAVFLQDHTTKLPADRRARYEALLRGDGWLSLVAEPAGARARILAYEPVSRYMMTNEDKARIETAPIRKMRLERGSYLVLLTAPGHRETRYPVAIGRDEHWDGIRPGSLVPYPVRLLREDALDPDDIHVPAGWFIAGGDPSAGESMPRCRVWVDDFVIQRHPVTNSEYLDFLNALVAEGRSAEAFRHCPRQALGGTSSGEPPLAYARDERSGRFALRTPEDEHALPVVFVDWHGATAYAEYIAQRTGLPWRLPSELEWEKAARGADGRFMPWGDQVEPTWACVSGSHPERKRLMPVHDYVTDVSPYGMRGAAGNVRDWCIERYRVDGPRVEDGVLQIEPAASGDDSERPMRGGAWISAGDLARLAVRYAERPSKRHGVLGFRLARSVT